MKHFNTGHMWILHQYMADLRPLALFGTPLRAKKSLVDTKQLLTGRKAPDCPLVPLKCPIHSWNSCLGGPPTLAYFWPTFKITLVEIGINYLPADHQHKRNAEITVLVQKINKTTRLTNGPIFVVENHLPPTWPPFEDTVHCLTFDTDFSSIETGKQVAHIYIHIALVGGCCTLDTFTWWPTFTPSFLWHFNCIHVFVLYLHCISFDISTFICVALIYA